VRVASSFNFLQSDATLRRLCARRRAAQQPMNPHQRIGLIVDANDSNRLYLDGAYDDKMSFGDSGAPLTNANAPDRRGSRCMSRRQTSRYYRFRPLSQCRTRAWIIGEAR
jgi:hypothetical protein